MDCNLLEKILESLSIITTIICFTFLIFATCAFARKWVKRKLYLFLLNRNIADTLGLFLYLAERIVKGVWSTELNTETAITAIVIANVFHRGLYNQVLLGTNLGMTFCKLLAVSRPLYYHRKVTTYSVAGAIALVWLLSFILSLPNALVVVANSFDNGTDSAVTRDIIVGVISRVVYVVCYLLNVVGSWALLRLIKRSSQQLAIRRSSTGVAANRAFNRIALEWSLLNYIVLQFPTFAFTCWEFILMSDSENQVGTLYCTVQGIVDSIAVVRMAIDSVLPFITDPPLRSACRDAPTSYTSIAASNNCSLYRRNTARKSPCIGNENRRWQEEGKELQEGVM